MDFTVKKYIKLLQTIKASGYTTQRMEAFMDDPSPRVIILRHDVELKPENSLAVAEIEKDFGIKANYYFRIVQESYDEDIISQIAGMGHEIGYHYENLSETN